MELLVFYGHLLKLQALEVLGDGHRTLIVPFIPTAENLAKWAFEQVEPHIESKYGQNIKLLAMNVRETPKSWASWKKD